MGSDWLIFFLSTVGFTIVITVSGLMGPIRSYIESKSERLGYLVQCPMCFGVWVGACAALIVDVPVFEAAFSTSLISWVLSNIVFALMSVSEYMESITEGAE
jgi:hypothetical protein